MTRKEAIKKTIFKYEWIKDNLRKAKDGATELDNFNAVYPEYQKYESYCPLCELFRTDRWSRPYCPECILNSDNCLESDSKFQNFLIEKSIPGKRKFCNWIIKKCKKALKAKNDL